MINIRNNQLVVVICAIAGLTCGGLLGFYREEWGNLRMFDNVDAETIRLMSGWYVKMCQAEIIQTKTNVVDGVKVKMR